MSCILHFGILPTILRAILLQGQTLWDQTPVTEIEWQWEGPEEILEAVHSEAQTILRRSRMKMLASQPRRLVDSK